MTHVTAPGTELLFGVTFIAWLTSVDSEGIAMFTIAGFHKLFVEFTFEMNFLERSSNRVIAGLFFQK